MISCEALFIECWKSGIRLSVNGDKLHLEARSQPSEDLLNKLKEHKHELLRFLSHWIDTPYGEAKLWDFVGEDRCGVILRHQPDRVKFIKLNELMVKPREEKKAAAAHEHQGSRLVRQGDGRKWQKVAEWDFRREGNRMIGQRLDAPGETSWTIEDTDHDGGEEKKAVAVKSDPGIEKQN